MYCDNIYFSKCLFILHRHIVVNGLEPTSNRIVLDMCAKYPNNILLPALGIYPVDACASAIALDPSFFPHRNPVAFDIDSEVAFIDQQASLKKIIAVIQYIYIYIYHMLRLHDKDCVCVFQCHHYAVTIPMIQIRWVSVVSTVSMSLLTMLHSLNRLKL
jgi:hypothetical protein